MNKSILSSFVQPFEFVDLSVYSSNALVTSINRLYKCPIYFYSRVKFPHFFISVAQAIQYGSPILILRAFLQE